MSFFPRAGGPVLEEGCWGPPSMTLSPGGGRTGLGFPLILPPPPPISIHVSPSRQLHNFSVFLCT